MRKLQLLTFALVALLLAPIHAVGAAAVVEVAVELQYGGNNYDDPCFWQDPTDPSTALACITSKDDGVVECFALPSGAFFGIADGFRGAANNCDVDQARGELVTTDNGGNRVLVHRLPDLGSAIRVLDDPDFADVTGVCVGHNSGLSRIFVTDESRLKVFVLDSVTGSRIGSFSHGLSKAEGIACDDRLQRVYVCDDMSDDRSCRAFTFDGGFIPPEFGIPETGSDSEGVAVYECGPVQGYVIVSDQSKDEFEVFDRQNPFAHLCTFQMEKGGDRTNDTDGIEVVQIPAYPNGIFGACDGCSGSSDELDLVAWERIAEACGLLICPLGELPGDTPLCGDGNVNQTTEMCDGRDDAACPGHCDIDCTCTGPPEAPSCGDGVVNQAGEECDGDDDARCPGQCQRDCVCADRPTCGDGTVNQAGEYCDGPDDDLCPGQCLTDCSCQSPPGPSGRPTAAVVADASTQQRSPDKNYDGDDLVADTRSMKHSFLRISASGIGGRAVTSALLRLTVSDSRLAKSDHGGRIHPTSCDWRETTITWRNQPAVDPMMIDEHAKRVRQGDRVTFDLTGHIPGDGDHCFALTSPSGNAVRYDSREMVNGPEVEITVADGPGTPAPETPWCGDDEVNRLAEECDGTDDELCPGKCRLDCACPEQPDDGAGPPTDGDTFACLASGADTVLSGTFTDDYRTRSLDPGTLIDARDATFIHCSQPDPSSPCSLNIYPVNLGPTSSAGACWAGGFVLGENRLDATWDDMHSPNNAGFIFENAEFTVDGLRIHNVGDGIRPRGGAANFVIKDVWLSHIRDDCVENDNMNAGLVEDSLFDGCFAGFSARHSNESVGGPDNVWTIRNSLVRLEPMPGPPDGIGPGHKTFFKWVSWGDANSRSPKLALHNNIFMAEQAGETSAEKMGIPPGKLESCSGNIMVWLGPGDYPAELPDCFIVVKDPSVWDRARADWIARHPELLRPR